jgi:hypothetical protein
MHFSTFEPTALEAIGLKAVNSSVLLSIFIKFLPSTPKPNLGCWKVKSDVGSQISVDPMMIRCSRRLLLLYSPLSLRWQATVHRVRPERFRLEGRQQISSNKHFTSSFLELQSDRDAVLCIPKQPKQSPWSKMVLCRCWTGQQLAFMHLEMLGRYQEGHVHQENDVHLF